MAEQRRRFELKVPANTVEVAEAGGRQNFFGRDPIGGSATAELIVTDEAGKQIGVWRTMRGWLLPISRE